MAQDYNKDLFIVLVGSGTTTLKNFVDNVEDYIFGDRDEREAELLIPYTDKMTPALGSILNDWAVGDDTEPNYPIHAFVQGDHGHKSVASAKQTIQVTEAHGVAMESAAVEEAMEALLEEQGNGNEVVVVVLYDEEKDVDLVGSLKNYQSVPVLNVNGMIDDFPGVKTTDEILREERLREEFEAKEAERIAAEKEQEKANKPAPAKKAAASRKRAAAKPVEDKPLTESAPRKAAAPRKKAVAPKPEPVVEPEHKVGDTVVVEGIPFTKHSELPKDLEPVKVIKPEIPQTSLGTPVAVSVQSSGVHPVHTDSTSDVWTDVAQAAAEVDKHPVTHYSVKKENLVALGEGIKAMSEAHAKTIDALLTIIEGK